MESPYGNEFSDEPSDDLKLDLAELLRVDRDEVVERLEIERLPRVGPRGTFSAHVISLANCE